MKKWIALKITKGILFFGLIAGLLGWLVMSLWNNLVPELFAGPVIGFWQAVGLLLLSHILFRGWSPWRMGHGWRHERWRKKLEEKLAAMTPEEREKFKAEWRRRCGPWGMTADSNSPAGNA
ncbi:MAG: hypothetical protein KDC45_05940 [Bacteroidetes bacterium]|nr:hypothetical protein [Bacteroidota bacterium]